MAARLIHLFAAPGDFPATLCGLNRVWGNPYAAVYMRDLDKVDCPGCLRRVTRRGPEPDADEDEGLS